MCVFVYVYMRVYHSVSIENCSVHNFQSVDVCSIRVIVDHFCDIPPYQYTLNDIRVVVLVTL